MYKLAYHCETRLFKSFSALPQGIQNEINRILFILDESYGDHRDATKDLGGYVVILESTDDVNSFNDFIDVNLNTATFEYVDVVSDYLGCLLLLGSDYHLYIVLPHSIATLNILRQINP